MASSQHSVPDDVLVRAIVAHRKVNPAAYQGVGLTVIEETAMAAALTQVEARIEVELELRKAAYERIRNLEEQYGVLEAAHAKNLEDRDALDHELGDLKEQYEVLESSEAQAWNKAQFELDERQRWAAETHRLEEQLEAALKTAEIQTTALGEALEQLETLLTCDCVHDPVSSRACPKCGRRAVAYPAMRSDDA